VDEKTNQGVVELADVVNTINDGLTLKVLVVASSLEEHLLLLLGRGTLEQLVEDVERALNLGVADNTGLLEDV